jgi:glycosyltransferase involved in cell wall biosynthesis
MRIVIICSGYLPSLDGVSVTLDSRLKRLSAKGYQVLVFVPDYSQVSKFSDWSQQIGEIYPGVEVCNVRSNVFFGMELERNIVRTGFRQIHKKILEFKPDIIHVDEPERMYFSTFVLAGIKSARILGVPCIAHFHTNFILFSEDYLSKVPRILAQAARSVLSRLIRYVYNSYDSILVSSASAKRSAEALGINNVHCGHFVGVDLDLFTPTKYDSNFWSEYLPTISEDSFKVLFIGRFTEDKGWDFGVKCLKLLATQDLVKDCSFIFVGEGALREEVEAHLSNTNVKVVFLGKLSPNELSGVVANADLHVSFSEKETLGLTVLEAQASGVPVLVPNSMGVLSNVECGISGETYIPAQQSDFAIKFMKLYEDESYREKLASEALARVQAFSSELAFDNLLKFWLDKNKSDLDVLA